MDSALNVGIGGGSRAMKVIDRTRQQQVEMERRENKHRKALENIYGSSGIKAPSYEPSSR
jgi:hypothetical protein